jgi:hypothetical protein
MIVEHLFYTAAIAIIAGMLFFRFTGRDSSWIIILCTYLPDLDKVIGRVIDHAGFTLLFQGHPIQHGAFHTIAMMVVFGIIVAFLLHPFGIRFFDGLLFAMIGVGAHLFEDALVYPSNYMYLWPIYPEKTGLAWLPMGLNEESYSSNFFHLANTEVLVIGIILVIIAAAVRTYVEGYGWIRWYMPEKLYQKYFGKQTPGVR